MKHTPTPWILAYNTIGSPIVISKDENRAICKTHTNYYNAKANAERIVDCVNSFEGIEDPTSFMEVVKTLELDAYHQMKAERDELLSALKQLADAYEATIEEEYGGTSKRPDCTELANAKQLLTKYTI